MRFPDISRQHGLRQGVRPVATLVERSTRFLMLGAMPSGHQADAVAAGVDLAQAQAAP